MIFSTSCFRGSCCLLDSVFAVQYKQFFVIKLKMMHPGYYPEYTNNHSLNPQVFDEGMHYYQRWAISSRTMHGGKDGVTEDIMDSWKTEGPLAYAKHHVSKVHCHHESKYCEPVSLLSGKPLPFGCFCVDAFPTEFSFLFGLSSFHTNSYASFSPSCLRFNFHCLSSAFLSSDYDVQHGPHQASWVLFRSVHRKRSEWPHQFGVSLRLRIFSLLAFSPCLPCCSSTLILFEPPPPF